MRAPPPESRGAAALQLACAAAVGWLLPYGANALLGLSPVAVVPMHTPRSAAWLAAWVASVMVAAFVLSRLARNRAVAGAGVAALGGLAALAAPFLAYGLPWRLLPALWPEAALLVFALPLAAMALVRRR